MIGLKTRHAVRCIMSKLYLLFETVNNTFEKIREVWISNDFLKFIYQNSIEFWMQKFLQTDLICFDQFKVPTVKFEK